MIGDKSKALFILTTIRLDKDFQADLRMWCIHHHLSMSKFIEAAAREKLASLLEDEIRDQESPSK